MPVIVRTYSEVTVHKASTVMTARWAILFFALHVAPLTKMVVAAAPSARVCPHLMWPTCSQDGPQGGSGKLSMLC